MLNFCPTCGTALMLGLCRKCNGGFSGQQTAHRQAPGRVTRSGGNVSFSGAPSERRGRRRDRRDPTETSRDQATITVEKESAPVERAATRWKGGVAGEPHPQLGLFPFDTIREGQKGFARDVQRAVRRGEHLVAHAPTGIGKTAAALAPALHAALDQEKRLLVLTSKQSQHRIVVDTLRSIQERRGTRVASVDVISKRDMCPRLDKDDVHPAAFADWCTRLCKKNMCDYFSEGAKDAVAEVRQGIHHVEELVDISLTHGCCPHKVAMESAKEAQVITCDYNYLFSDLRDRILESLGSQLEDFIVIVDEAHNLPDRVRANFSLDLTPWTLDEAKAEARRERDQVTDLWCTTLAEVIATLADPLEPGEEMVLAKTDLLGPLEERMSQGTLDGVARKAKDLLDSLQAVAKLATKAGAAIPRSGQVQEFLAAWVYGGAAHGRILRKEKTGNWRLLHTLLDPGYIAGPIFEAAHSAVIMSGTLYPPEMYRDMLGLREARTRIRLYNSPYDKNNRPVVCVKGVTSRYKDRSEAMYDRIATMVADTHRAARGNTAAFFLSYHFLETISQRLEDQGIELIVESKAMTKAERQQVLDQLEGARGRDGALLLGVLGGSLSEGVDYKDNLLRAVSVVGLPLAPPGREVDLLVEHFERKFPRKGREYGYVYPAMTRVLQAAGRGVRGPNDRCAVLLLDERYAWNMYSRCFPDDFRPTLVDDPVHALMPFFDAFP